VITPLTAAILDLGLNEAAYMAEIARAGIASVDDGQVKAAQALGMSRQQTFRRIILPQAMRMIVPPTANEAIGLLKTSSIASVIAVTGVALFHTAHLRGQLPDHSAADCGQYLVSDGHDNPDDRPTLSGTPLQQRPPSLMRVAPEHAPTVVRASDRSEDSPMVCIGRVHKWYARFEVLAGVSLEVCRGEVHGGRLDRRRGRAGRDLWQPEAGSYARFLSRVSKEL
jgi:hypothetical protein